MGYVYVITTEIYEKKNIYKIGCTKNIENRLRLINATRILEDRFFVVRYWNTYKYFETEAGLHNQLCKYRLNNEFFKCELNIVEIAIRNFCATKNLFFIIPDSVYFFLLENNIQWNEEKQYFTVNDENYLLDEKRVLKKYKKYFRKFDKKNLFRFSSDSFWGDILLILKKVKFVVTNDENDGDIKNLSNILDDLEIK